MNSSTENRFIDISSSPSRFPKRKLTDMWELIWWSSLLHRPWDWKTFPVGVVFREYSLLKVRPRSQALLSLRLQLPRIDASAVYICVNSLLRCIMGCFVFAPHSNLLFSKGKVSLDCFITVCIILTTPPPSMFQIWWGHFWKKGNLFNWPVAQLFLPPL